jgi:hypothetical protein
MTGAPYIKFVADCRFADPLIAKQRFLEIENGLEADKGRFSIASINRTMLDEGASVDEHIAARDRAVVEGLIKVRLSGAYLIFRDKGRCALSSRTHN